LDISVTIFPGRRSLEFSGDVTEDYTAIALMNFTLLC